jgi:hypothetical protein
MGLTISPIIFSSYNPFLYGWYNESFQKEFVQIAPILRFICGSGSVTRQSVAANDMPMRDLNPVNTFYLNNF